MALMTNITAAVKSAWDLYDRLWTAALRGLDPESVAAAAEDAGAHRVCAVGQRIGFAGCEHGGTTVHRLLRLAVQIGRLLYREVASRVDPNSVSSVVEALYQVYKNLKYVVPWIAPWIFSLLRYIRQPAFPKQPRHARERSYGVMAERAGSTGGSVRRLIVLPTTTTMPASGRVRGCWSVLNHSGASAE